MPVKLCPATPLREKALLGLVLANGWTLCDWNVDFSHWQEANASLGRRSFEKRCFLLMRFFHSKRVDMNSIVGAKLTLRRVVSSLETVLVLVSTTFEAR